MGCRATEDISESGVPLIVCPLTLKKWNICVVFVPIQGLTVIAVTSANPGMASVFTNEGLASVGTFQRYVWLDGLIKDERFCFNESFSLVQLAFI